MNSPQRDRMCLVCMWLEDGIKDKDWSVSSAVVREKVAMPVKAGLKTV